MTLSPSDAAKTLGAFRKRATFACEVCDKAFTALDRPRQQPRTCSPACRQKLYRREKAAREP